MTPVTSTPEQLAALSWICLTPGSVIFPILSPKGQDVQGSQGGWAGGASFP